MSVLPLFDLEKGLLLLYLSSNLRQEVEMWYADLVQAIDFPFGDFDLLILFHPSTLNTDWDFFPLVYMILQLMKNKKNCENFIFSKEYTSDDYKFKKKTRWMNKPIWRSARITLETSNFTTSI